jgi:hypothetical protein
MKLSEIEHRILALEHALSNLQRCPADPCHVHYVAEEAVAEPKHDVTQENWRVGYVGDSGVIVNLVDPLEQMQVCQAPESWMRGRKHWPQRRVLIAHAPEMYRVLSNLANGIPVGFGDARQLLAIIKKELQDNE